MESLDLSGARVVVERRPAYLLITERGPLASLRDVQRYAAFVEAVAQRRSRSAVLIDARLGEPDARGPAVRDAFWAWLVSGRVIFRVAWVLPGDLAVAHVNVDSVSQRVPVRAFSTAQDAHHWLTSGGIATAPTVRPSSAGQPGMRAPVPSPTPASGARRPSPGGEERITPAPREREPSAPPSDPAIARAISSHPPEPPSGSIPLAAIRPSQVALPRAEAERLRSSAPPGASEERVVVRSDVVPRRRSLVEIEIEDTGSDDER